MADRPTLGDVRGPKENAVRETKEEFNNELYPASLTHVGVLTAYIQGEPDALVHVFWTNIWNGEPEETEEMIPEWFSLEHIPYGHMLEACEPWMPRALRKEPFGVNIFYAERAKGLQDLELVPYQNCSVVY